MSWVDKGKKVAMTFSYDMSCLSQLHGQGESVGSRKMGESGGTTLCIGSKHIYSNIQKRAFFNYDLQFTLQEPE